MRWRKPWTKGIAACRATSSSALAEKLLEIRRVIEAAIALELADGTVIADRLDERDVRLPLRASTAEQSIAKRLLELAAGAALAAHRRRHRDPMGRRPRPG